MKSHFYQVQATNNNKRSWKRTFIWCSEYEIQEFSEHVEALMYEWSIEDIREISYRNMEVIQFWDSESSE